jgi:hypothetical protein
MNCYPEVAFGFTFEGSHGRAIMLYIFCKDEILPTSIMQDMSE